MKAKQTLKIKCISSIYSKMTLDWRCWTLGATLLVLMLCLSISIASTCPSSIPKTTATTIEQYIVNESPTKTLKVISSTISDSLYIFDTIPSYSVVRKINSSGTQLWGEAFEISILTKSLAIDLKESNVYFASYNNPVTVFRLNSTNGAILNQHKYE